MTCPEITFRRWGCPATDRQTTGQMTSLSQSMSCSLQQQGATKNKHRASLLNSMGCYRYSRSHGSWNQRSRSGIKIHKKTVFIPLQLDELSLSGEIFTQRCLTSETPQKESHGTTECQETLTLAQCTKPSVWFYSPCESQDPRKQLTRQKLANVSRP